MISVDVNERAIESNRAFVKRDQGADVERTCAGNAYRDRFASFFVKRGARSAQKSMQIIAAGYFGFDLERGTISIFRDFNECDKKIQDAVAQLLHVGVLIGRSLVSINCDSLIHSLAI